ncbi:MAG: hypothetical protein ACRDZ0_08880 [Acidimicrobiales bacterium]
MSDNLGEDQVPATWFQCDAGIRRLASPQRRPFGGVVAVFGESLVQRIERTTRSSWRAAVRSDRSVS